MRRVLISSSAFSRIGAHAATRSAGRWLAIVTTFAAAACWLTVAAEAKPTGWQSESEMRSRGAQAWSGYGDSGYVGRPAKSRKANSNSAKSKALKAYGSTYGSKKSAKSNRSSKKKYAALDTGAMIDTTPSKSITGGGVRWAANRSCLNGTLVAVVGQVAANYGPVTVNSTCRSKSRNRAVGGAKKSHHLSGNAVDFRVRGNVRAVYAYLRSHGSLGGVKHYGGGLFHIDTGPKRSW
jgi:hypothetical protein